MAEIPLDSRRLFLLKGEDERVDRAIEIITTTKFPDRPNDIEEVIATLFMVRDVIKHIEQIAAFDRRHAP